MVRSPSGDIDILVLFILHQFDEKKVFIDNDFGKNRKIIDMSTSTLPLQQIQALAGMHAFFGNDYVSSFFGKGKQRIWTLIIRNEKFLQTFSELGLFSYATDALKIALEEFTCRLYGDKKNTKVNELRCKMFETKSKGKGKNVDLINWPPCWDNLSLHTDRACYVANMFHESRRLMMLLDDPTEHGWEVDGKVKWSVNYFPDDIDDLLLSCENNDDNDVSNDEDDDNTN